MRRFLTRVFDSGLRALGLRSVKQQFTFSYLVIVLFAILSFLSLRFSVEHTEPTINMAGLQRMLSQKVAKEAILVEKGIELDASLRATINQFELAQKHLIQGRPESGILPPMDAEIARRLMAVEAVWADYVQTVAFYIEGQDIKALERLHKHSNQISTQMDAIVQLMTDKSTQDLIFQRYVTASLMALIVTLALISQFFGVHWLMRQIARFRLKLIDLSKGDFSKTLRVESSQNEIGEMAYAYKMMQANIKCIVEGVLEKTSAINVNTNKLGSSASDSEKGACKQADEIKMVTIAMGQMTEAVNDVAKHSELAADSAVVAHDDASDAQQKVNQSFDHINGMALELEGAGDVVAQLQADSEKINTVLTVITSVAEQTNLLALNAAIEAARAGDQGRGFSVVADEVRSLAQKTQDSTKQIQTIIEKFQSQTKDAVRAVRSSVEMANSCKGNMCFANDALKKIVVAAANIQDMTSRIATAAQQQSSVGNEIDENLDAISDVSSQTSKLASEAYRLVGCITEDVSALSHIVGHVKVRQE